MDSIKLIRPDSHYKDALLEYCEEFLTAHETIHGSGGLERFASFEEWLKACVEGEHEETTPEGRVPATQYLAVREQDSKLVGMIQVRHFLNEYLKREGGHIGYSVRKSERRKGYAAGMLNAALKDCKVLGITRVLVTCEPNNIASAGVIKANGGVYEKQIATEANGKLDHYWIAIS